MAVIFAVVGGGAVAVIGVGSSYSEYSAYSDAYSDAAERKRLRMENKKKEISDAAVQMGDYKRNYINPYLTSQNLVYTNAVNVSPEELDNDVRSNIEKKMREEIDSNSQIKEYQKELQEIEALLERLDKEE